MMAMIQTLYRFSISVSYILTSLVHKDIIILTIFLGPTYVYLSAEYVLKCPFNISIAQSNELRPSLNLRSKIVKEKYWAKYLKQISKYFYQSSINWDKLGNTSHMIKAIMTKPQLRRILENTSYLFDNGIDIIHIHLKITVWLDHMYPYEREKKNMI